MNTGFDFKKIIQIMISDSTDCPTKEEFKYINVLCFTHQPMPIILPYLYKDEKENNLDCWLFINSKGVRVKQKVSSFSEFQI